MESLEGMRLDSDVLYRSLDEDESEASECVRALGHK
jgi:hypothetical protein